MTSRGQINEQGSAAKSRGDELRDAVVEAQDAYGQARSYAAAVIEDADLDRRAAITAAVAGGHTKGDIARLVGVSHTHIRRLTASGRSDR